MSKTEISKVLRGFPVSTLKAFSCPKEMRSHGIGKQLLDRIKAKKPVLRLNVYRKNTRAVRFYEREGFEIQCGGTDGATGEKDLLMVWRRGI